MLNLENIPHLDRWRGAARVWALGFLVLAGLGLCVSLLMVAHDSGLAPADVGTRFAGPESDEIYPHTLGSLLQTTHTHLYTLAFLELLLGGFFLLSSASSRAKVFWIGLAWTAMLLDHAGMWTVFKFGRAWVWMLMLGGTAMSVAMFTQVGWCLKDLVKSRSDQFSK
jgi:hypothetical protein